MSAAPGDEAAADAALPEAFYTRDGDAFAPTALTIGPWDPSLQHGGPPAALLARAAERHQVPDAEGTWSVVRLTVELLRPIPLRPVTVGVEPLRVGRQAQWLEAHLAVEGQVVARARAVRIREVAVLLPPRHTEPRAAPPPPEGPAARALEFQFFPVPLAYHRGIEARIVEGTWAAGPATVWARLRRPLVAGEPTSALERTLTLADASNGVAPALTTGTHSFVNPDLTVYLRRPPEGEWLALAVRSIPEPTGVGLVESDLFDRRGEVGRCLQSLVVRER